MILLGMQTLMLLLLQTDYALHHAARTGEAVGILLRDSLKFKHHPCVPSSSFESYQFTFTSAGLRIHVANVYQSLLLHLQ